MTALTLYQLEDDLLAWLNSIDMAEDPELRAEAEQAMIAAHLAAVDKRDNVSRFLAHLDGQVAAIDKESERLQDLKRSFQRVSERTANYVVHVIEELGPDDYGKWRKLSGNTCQFSITKNPAAVTVDDLEAVPDTYCDTTVKMAKTDWEDFIGELDVDQRTTLLTKLKAVDKTARRTDIRKALEANESVPGAELAKTKYRLVRK